MNSTTDYPGFLQVAEQIGLKNKLLYTLREVSQVTGIAYRTLLNEMHAGRLRVVDGMNGHFVRPAWVDEWIERNAKNA